MKYLFPFISLLLVVVFTTACTDDVLQETSNTELPAGIDSIGTQLSAYDKNVQTLIQDPNGLIRGFSLGMESDVVKSKNANLQKVDSSSTSATYSVQLDPVEAADFEYQFTDKKVSKIEIVIYPENEYRQGVYFRDLKNYFSAKFNTKATEDNNSLTWKVPSKDIVIHLTKVGTRKIHDLQLVFEKLK